MTKRTLTTCESSLAENARKFVGKNARYIFLPVNPVPASRPRVSRWGTYYGKNYEDFRKKVRDYLHDQPDNTPLDGEVYCIVEAVVEKPKTTKRGSPRGDVDNYAKGILDSLTQHAQCWGDDDQVVELVVSKRFTSDGEQPGIHVWIKEIE